MANVTIRPATEADLSRLQVLALRFYAEETPHDPDLNVEFPRTPKGQEYLRSFITNADRTVVVAETDGIIGYASGEYVNNPVNRHPHCQFHELFLESEFRRQGIGTSLNEALTQWAHDKGAKHMKLNVYHLNESAQQFYQRQGFQPKHHNLTKEIDG